MLTRTITHLVFSSYSCKRINGSEYKRKAIFALWQKFEKKLVTIFLLLGMQNMKLTQYVLHSWICLIVSWSKQFYFEILRFWDSFLKQCLQDLHFMKTRYLSPNLSKLVPADISWSTLFSLSEKHCFKNKWILVEEWANHICLKSWNITI